MFLLCYNNSQIDLQFEPNFEFNFRINNFANDRPQSKHLAGVFDTSILHCCAKFQPEFECKFTPPVAKVLIHSPNHSWTLYNTLCRCIIVNAPRKKLVRI